MNNKGDENMIWETLALLVVVAFLVALYKGHNEVQSPDIKVIEVDEIIRNLDEEANAKIKAEVMAEVA